MFGKGSAVFSIIEIRSFYPDEWVAITIAETDADGFAVSGEVIVHDADEQAVWSAARLGEMDEPIYVFFTGPRGGVTVAA
jgi:hypothetical protein